MANIPTYQRQVGLRPVPNARIGVRVTPEDMGAGLGRALEQGGQVVTGALTQVAQKEREEQRQAQLMDAYAELGKVRQDIQSTIVQQRGKDALAQDLPTQATTLLDQAAEKIAERLPDDETRAAFKRIHVQQQLGLRDAASDHFLRESEAFKDRSYKGARTTAVQLGIQGAAAAPAGKAADSKEVAAARQTVLDAVALRTQTWPEDAAAAERTGALTELHAGALERLLTGDRNADAERYLTRWRGEMDPEVVGKLEERLRRDGLRAGAFQLAEEALAAGRGRRSLVVDLDAAATKLEELLDGKPAEVRIAAREQLRARVGELEEVRKQRTSQVFATALQAFNKPGADGRPNNRISSIPGAVRDYLTDPANGREAAELWDALQRKAEAQVLQQRSLAEKPTEANWAAYGALVKDMQDRPEYYRTMDGQRFTAEVYGKVGPLIDKAMSLYKSATEPQADQRSLTVDETRTVILSLPSQYRPTKWMEPTSELSQIWDIVRDEVGEKKAKEWDGKKGAVPAAVLKQWVAEVWASGTVKGGKLWGLMDKTGVPRPVAIVAFEGKAWTPDQGGAPAIAAPPPAGEPTSADVDRVQAAWKARYPGRPPLTLDQVKRSLAAEKGSGAPPGPRAMPPAAPAPSVDLSWMSPQDRAVQDVGRALELERSVDLARTQWKSRGDGRRELTREEAIRIAQWPDSVEIVRGQVHRRGEDGLYRSPRHPGVYELQPDGTFRRLKRQ